MKKAMSALLSLTMTALIIFPVVFFVERLTAANAAPFAFVLRSAPLLLCYFAGRFSRGLGQNISVAVFAGSAAAAVALIAVLTGGIGLYPVLCLIPCVILYILSLCIRDYFPVSFCIGGLILYFLAILIIPSVFRLDSSFVLSVCGLVFLLLSMFSFNTQGVRLAMHSTSGAIRTPAGLVRKNLIMTLCFIAVSLLLSMVLPIGQLLVYPLRWLVLLFRWLKSLLQARNAGLEYGEVQQDDGSAFTGLGFAVSDRTEAAWVMYVVYIVAGLVCLALLGCLIWKLFKTAGRTGGLLGKIAQKFSALFKKEESVEYEDDIESLFDLESLLRSGGEAIGSLFGRLRRRELSFDDMPDTAARLRFTYKAVLKKLVTQGGDAMSKTPTELLSGRGTEFELFSGDYNTVRYSTHAPSDNAEDTARQVLHKLGS